MTKLTPPITRSALRYRGGKGDKTFAAWIISHFPPHQVYVEPYGGAANILLRKQPSQFEVYNDLYSEVIRFFDVLRSQPDELIRAIELTPWSADEWKRCYEPVEEPLEAARRFYVRSWQSFGGASGAQWRTGWRRQLTPHEGAKVLKRWNSPDNLWAAASRLKAVQIDSLDALECIRRYDRQDALFYCDPTYPSDVRRKWKNTMYAHEMSEADHRAFADLLKSIQGLAIVSGYDCDLYQELFRNWSRVSFTAWTDLGGQREESLWLSPRTVEALAQSRSEHRQLSLLEADL